VNTSMDMYYTFLVSAFSCSLLSISLSVHHKVAPHLIFLRRCILFRIFTLCRSSSIADASLSARTTHFQSIYGHTSRYCEPGYPFYQRKVLFPTTYKTHHFGTHSNTHGNQSTSALDPPLDTPHALCTQGKD